MSFDLWKYSRCHLLHQYVLMNIPICAYELTMFCSNKPICKVSIPVCQFEDESAKKVKLEAYRYTGAVYRFAQHLMRATGQEKRLSHFLNYSNRPQTSPNSLQSINTQQPLFIEEREVLGTTFELFAINSSFQFSSTFVLEHLLLLYCTQVLCTLCLG